MRAEVDHMTQGQKFPKNDHMTHFIMEIYTVLNVGLVILQNLQVLTKLIDYIVSYKQNKGFNCN